MRLNEIYGNLRNKIRFCCIYIREAHPEDSIGGFRTERNWANGIILDQPTTIEERGQIAEVCTLDLKLAMH